MVSYTREQRAYAKAHAQHLVTLDMLGVTFQGSVPREEAERLLAFWKELMDRRAARKAEAASGKDAP